MIRFIKKNEELIGIYESEGNTDIKAILTSLKNHAWYMKRTFYLTLDKVVTLDTKDLEEHDIDEDEYIAFSLGKMQNDYFLLDKTILSTEHNVYIDKTLDIQRIDFIKYFVAYNNISIFRSIDNVLNNDIYIDKTTKEYTCGIHVPFEQFQNLIKCFPNRTEHFKYTNFRIAHVLNNYFNNYDKYRLTYEKYLEKKENLVKLNQEPNSFVSNIKLDLLKTSKEQLTYMLKNQIYYSEKDWQKNIKDIISVLFPKYLYTLREVNIGMLNGNYKYPDFTLVDSNGFVDIMEIKKPDDTQVMRTSKVRNNYVPQKIFTDVIIQATKYILALNTNMTTAKESIINKIKNTNPSQQFTVNNIRINNPKGIVLFGRSDQLNKDQKDDLELIKRQYKDIPEIMTYDDLLERLDNLIKCLESQVQN